MEQKNVKKRNWAFVLYPESAPEDWKERLRTSGLKCAISPLHDQDVNPTGEKKKPHYHVILVYEGPTTFSNVKNLTLSLNQPIPQPLEQVRGYYRYLTHADNPEKAQYDETGIDRLNGFDIADFVEMTRSEVQAIIRKLLALIRDADLTEYADLLDLLLDSNMLQELEVACNHTILFRGYLESKRYQRKGSGKGV